MHPPDVNGVLHDRLNQDIKKKQRIILVGFIIELILTVLSLITLTVGLVGYSDKSNRINENERRVKGLLIADIIFASVSIVHIVLFIVAVGKKKRIILLTLLWIRLAELIGVLIAVVVFSTLPKNENKNITIGVHIFTIAGVNILLTIINLIFGFKLAKLLKIRETQISPC